MNIEQLFYWTGAVLLTGVVLAGTAAVWWYALALWVRNIKDTYSAIDLRIWVRLVERRRRKRAAKNAPMLRFAYESDALPFPSGAPPIWVDAAQPSAKSAVTETEKVVNGVPVPHMEFDPELVYRLLRGAATLPSKDEQQRRLLHVALTYLTTIGSERRMQSEFGLGTILAALRTYWSDEVERGAHGAEAHMQQLGGQMHAINTLLAKASSQEPDA